MNPEQNRTLKPLARAGWRPTCKGRLHQGSRVIRAIIVGAGHLMSLLQLQVL